VVLLRRARIDARLWLTWLVMGVVIFSYGFA
jgi:hypothetical protein